MEAALDKHAKLTAADSLVKLKAMIAKYYVELAVEAEKPDVVKYLSASEDFIRRMTPEDCSIAAITLTRYGMFIQQHYNKEVAVVNWATQKIRSLIASSVSQYNSRTPWEECRALAIGENEYTKELDHLRTLAQIRVDSLNGTCFQISDMAKRFDNAAHSKNRGSR